MKENLEIINSICDDVFKLLLFDRTTNKNIIWATNDYSDFGEGYEFDSSLCFENVCCEKTVIKPRIEKNKEEQYQRSKNNAEVFTPAWACNIQNNLVDRTLLGCKFNIERYSAKSGHRWEYSSKPIEFPRPNGTTWQDYVRATRMEISCGEAPYITSRYDAVTGKFISVKQRIGLLDRKLRIVGEYVKTDAEWIEWAEISLKSVYGFEYQGDNLYIARRNILFTVAEHYFDKFNCELTNDILLRYAEIISWNIWQMDGLRFVVPNTCHKEIASLQMTLFEETEKMQMCPGCEKHNRYKHNGTYCYIKDWDNDENIRFVDLLGGK